MVFPRKLIIHIPSSTPLNYKSNRSFPTVVPKMSPRKAPSPFSRGSPAHNFLKTKLQRGDIKPTDRPKNVRDKFKVEMLSMGVSPASSQNSFRSMFHRAKEEYLADKGDDVAEDVIEDCQELGGSRRGTFTPRKRLHVSDLVEDMADSEEEGTEQIGHIVNEGLIPPLHRVEQWKEPSTLTERVTVYLHLHAGAFGNDFDVHISDDGRSLQINLYWPKPMTDPTMMLRKSLREAVNDPGKAAEVHAELQAFTEGLRRYRANLGDRISTSCIIPLPIIVQKEVVSQSWVQWADTAFQGLIVRLRGLDVSYGIVKPEFKLEMV